LINRSTDLGGEERAKQRVKASGAHVGDAEVDNGQLVSPTHPAVSHAAAAAADVVVVARVFLLSFDVRRWKVVRDGQRTADQTDPWRQRLIRQRHRPSRNRTVHVAKQPDQ